MSDINKDVEKFLLETMGKRHPEIPRSTKMMWACNYYLEIENAEAFHSDNYENEELRAEDMFRGMPEEELKLVSLKFYKSRSDSKGEDHEKRIAELEAEITDPELVEVSSAMWWAH